MCNFSWRFSVHAFTHYRKRDTVINQCKVHKGVHAFTCCTHFARTFNKLSFLTCFLMFWELLRTPILPLTFNWFVALMFLSISIRKGSFYQTTTENNTLLWYRPSDLQCKLFIFQTQLDKLHLEISKTLEKMASREKYINNQVMRNV